MHQRIILAYIQGKGERAQKHHTRILGNEKDLNQEQRRQEVRERVLAGSLASADVDEAEDDKAQADGMAGGAHQGADGVEHVNENECDNQGDQRKSANLQEAREIELQEGQVEHAVESGDPGSCRKRRERVLAQEGRLTDSIHQKSHQHANKHAGFHAFVGQKRDDEQADEGRHH